MPAAKPAKPARKGRALSPTSAVMKYFRDDGYDIDVCERYLVRGKIRKDLFGWADLIAVGHGRVFFVQACHKSDIGKRVTKIRECADRTRTLLACLSAGARCLIIGVENNELSIRDLSLLPSSDWPLGVEPPGRGGLDIL